MADVPQHPGSLSTMGKIWEGIKHVGSKALKWAAKAAIVGGIIGLIVAAPLALATGGVGSVLGPTIMGFLNTITFGLIPASGAVTAIGGLMTGLGLGAAVGGILGGVSGIGGASDAARDAEAESISNYERGEARELKMNALMQRQAEQKLALMQRAQAIAPGLTPGMDQSAGRNV